MLQSVGHLESDLNQKLISSSPLMGDSCCKTRLKYLDQCLRYFGTIFIKIFTYSAILRISFIELNYKVYHWKDVTIPFKMRYYKPMFEKFQIF